jgi:hypothetical protein
MLIVTASATTTTTTTNSVALVRQITIPTEQLPLAVTANSVQILFGTLKCSTPVSVFLPFVSRCDSEIPSPSCSSTTRVSLCCFRKQIYLSGFRAVSVSSTCKFPRLQHVDILPTPSPGSREEDCLKAYLLDTQSHADRWLGNTNRKGNCGIFVVLSFVSCLLLLLNIRCMKV